jgi:LytS/YehU family sensor histidine kinase
MKRPDLPGTALRDRWQRFRETVFMIPHLSTIHLLLLPQDHRRRHIRSGIDIFPRSFIRSPLWVFVSCLLGICLVIPRNLYQAIATGGAGGFLYDDIGILPMLLVVVGVGIYMLWFLYLEEKLCNYEARIQEEKIARLSREQKLLQSRLKLLKAQVEPHFLFNTLTSIASLDDSDPERARTMQENFMHYLEATFGRMRSAQTTVHREVELLRAYLDIFRIRMGKRLQYGISVQKNIGERRFPSMLIQPVVENAIHHGLEPEIEGGRIDLSVQSRKGRLVWKVADNGTGMSEMTGLGIGLGNIIDRLQGLYGDTAELRVEENRPRGTIVTIEVPYA